MINLFNIRSTSIFKGAHLKRKDSVVLKNLWGGEHVAPVPMPMPKYLVLKINLFIHLLA